MSEAERLTAFLLALQTSPAQRAELRRDAHGVLRRFNLSPKTIAALHNKDYETLWRILVSGSGRHGEDEIMTTVGVEKKRRSRRRIRS